MSDDTSDDLRDGIACWLAGEESLDWDELDEDDRGGYRDSATDLLRFVREPLADLAQVPTTAEDVRAAERAWMNLTGKQQWWNPKHAFIAEHLNRRGETPAGLPVRARVEREDGGGW